MPDSALSDTESAHLAARVVWLYFVGGLTQQEIAERLQITRLRANKLIGQARIDGSVVFDIRLRLAECVALEEALKERFGLEDVCVVPSVPDYAELQRVVGEAAAAMVHTLGSGRKGLGVGWGRTLSCCARRLDDLRWPDPWVVGLMGGVSRGSGINTFEVSTAVAHALGAECYYLTAPIYCPSAESRQILSSYDQIATVLQRAEEAEMCLVSCSDLSDRNPIMSIGIVKQLVNELESLGAIGEVLGCFMDADGGIVPHPINSCVMALPLEKLRQKPISILASGGLNKLPIIRSILRGRYINRLVTDEQVAQELVN
ncbi:sugar-binding domain-containing protein [Shinella sp. S4-D37]|uniref:sugar-binding transcriptional regulator n=1 Tax=Shinella sp. S4-D37 TaxID=3161999 RepID=UPI0034677343